MSKKTEPVDVAERKEPATPDTTLVPADAPAYLKLSEPAVLKKELKRQMEIRKVMTQIIKEYLVEDVDYGRIHIAKDCPNKYNLEACKNTSHWSKKNLFKSGSEKITGLYKLRAEYQKDEETASMLSSVKDAVFLLCKLVHIPSGEVVTEGRGACTLKEKYDNVNNAIKIAEKRAKIDAVLSLGFSDAFTQDLEDEDTNESRGTTTIVSSAPPATTISEEERKATFIKSIRERLDQYPPEERAKHKAATIERLLPLRKEFTKEELEKAL